MKNKTFLQLKNATVKFENITALENVSISINEGEIVSLIGANGAGKSTILKAIFGVVKMKEGKVILNDKKIKPTPNKMTKQGFSYVPQGKQVFLNLTIEENLEIGAYIVYDKKIIKQRLQKIYKIFPVLNEKRNEKAKNLSGGQQQLLAIARGLMTEPKVLFLDEPSIGLSPKIIKEIFAVIEKINKNYNTAIIIVEHNLKSLITIVDKLYLLNKGKIITEINVNNVEKQKILEIVKKNIREN